MENKYSSNGVAGHIIFRQQPDETSTLLPADIGAKDVMMMGRRRRRAAGFAQGGRFAIAPDVRGHLPSDSGSACLIKALNCTA